MTDKEIVKLMSTIEMKAICCVSDETWGKALQLILELQEENASLRNEADENAALSIKNKLRADRLEKENASLRERLGRSIELPCIEHILTVRWELKGKLGKATENWCVLYKDSREGFIIEPYINKCSAESRLAELKGEK